jgi:hypothetical protein
MDVRKRQQQVSEEEEQDAVTCRPWPKPPVPKLVYLVGWTPHVDILKHTPSTHVKIPLPRRVTHGGGDKQGINNNKTKVYDGRTK